MLDYRLALLKRLEFIFKQVVNLPQQLLLAEYGTTSMSPVDYNEEIMEILKLFHEFFVGQGDDTYLARTLYVGASSRGYWHTRFELAYDYFQYASSGATVQNFQNPTFPTTRRIPGLSLVDFVPQMHFPIGFASRIGWQPRTTLRTTLPAQRLVRRFLTPAIFDSEDSNTGAQKLGAYQQEYSHLLEFVRSQGTEQIYNPQQILVNQGRGFRFSFPDPNALTHQQYQAIQTDILVLPLRSGIYNGNPEFEDLASLPHIALEPDPSHEVDGTIMATENELLESNLRWSGIPPPQKIACDWAIN
jgi:hypothetical protein